MSQQADPAMSALPRDIQAVICAHLTIGQRLCVARLLNKSWHAAVQHRLVWENTTFGRYPCSRDEQLNRLVNFWVNGHCTPRHLQFFSLYCVSAAGLLSLARLTDMRSLTLGEVNDSKTIHQVLTALSGSLEELELGHCKLRGGFVFPVMPHLRSLSLYDNDMRPHDDEDEDDKDEGFKGGVQLQPALTHLLLNDCDSACCMELPPSLTSVKIRHVHHHSEMVPRLASLPSLKLIEAAEFVPAVFAHARDFPAEFRCHSLETIIGDPIGSEELEQIAHLVPNIREISLCKGDVSGIAARTLGTLTTLTALELWNMARVSNAFTDDEMVCVRSLVNLHTLCLQGQPRVSSACLAHVASLPQLHTLRIYSCKGITSLEPLRACARLRHLECDVRVDDADARALSGVSTLEELELSAPVTSPSVIAAFSLMPSLHSLRLHQAEPLPSQALASLAACHALTELFLPFSGGFDAMLPHVCALSKLRVLKIGDCGSEKLSKTQEGQLRDAMPYLERLEIMTRQTHHSYEPCYPASQEEAERD